MLRVIANLSQAVVVNGVVIATLEREGCYLNAFRCGAKEQAGLLAALLADAIEKGLIKAEESADEIVSAIVADINGPGEESPF